MWHSFCWPGTPAGARRSSPFIVVAVLVAGLVMTSFARPSTSMGVGSVVMVSGADPFASCTIGSIGDDGQPGTIYPDAEVEPRVAVNPTNPSNMIGVWQQDRWSNGGAHGLLAAYTTDGGKTWTESSQQPAFTECAGGTAANGGNFERGSDPWITFSNDGTAFMISLSATFNTSLQPDSAILVSKSTDGGLTWSTPQQVNQVPSTQAFTPSVMVASDGTVAVTYYDLRNATSSDLSNLATDYWIVRSHDGGATFSEDHIAGPFNVLAAPNAGGFFLGDYEGLGPVGTSFLPFFVQAQPAATTGPTDVFSTTVSP